MDIDSIFFTFVSNVCVSCWNVRCKYLIMFIKTYFQGVRCEPSSLPKGCKMPTQECVLPMGQISGLVLANLILKILLNLQLNWSTFCLFFASCVSTFKKLKFP